MSDHQTESAVPNIATAREDHRRYCGFPGQDWNRPGDVRRCRHGRLQVGYEVLGCTSAYWRNLSPIWNPILYRRAVRVLTTPPGEGGSR